MFLRFSTIGTSASFSLVPGDISDSLFLSSFVERCRVYVEIVLLTFENLKQRKAMFVKEDDCGMNVVPAIMQRIRVLLMCRGAY